MTPLILISALVTSYMCYVDGQKSCDCVVYDECPPLYDIIKKPSMTPQELQTVRNAFCGYEGTKPKVCCKREPDNSCVNPDGQLGRCVGIYACPHIARLLAQKPVPPDVIGFVQNSRCEGPEQYNICCGPEQRPSMEPTGICVPSFAPPDRSTECCGRDGTQANRIIGGTMTGVDQYPWLALIEYRSPDNKIKLLCGAALISGKYVLTAGHCVVGSALSIGTPINVRLGEYDTSNEGRDCIPTEGNGRDCTDGLTIIAIDKIIPHPQYVPEKKVHDIALIRLAQLAPYTDFIRPICLPTSDATLSPPTNFTFFVAGWGAVDEKTSSSKVKLHVNVPFQSHEKCQPLYNVYRRSVVLGKGQLCAGGEIGKDSCKGDSGGPLMYENRLANGNSYFELIGIVSFGPSPCGKDAVPGVYTKTYEYNSWIRSNIKP